MSFVVVWRHPGLTPGTTRFYMPSVLGELLCGGLDWSRRLALVVLCESAEPFTLLTRPPSTVRGRLFTPDGAVCIKEVTLRVHALVKDGVKMVHCRFVEIALVGEFVKNLAKRASRRQPRTMTSVHSQLFLFRVRNGSDRGSQYVRSWTKRSLMIRP